MRPLRRTGRASSWRPKARTREGSPASTPGTRQTDRGGGGSNQVGQARGVDQFGGGREPVGSWSVEPHQGMEVDHAAQLVLSDLRVLHRRHLGQPVRGQLQLLGEEPVQGDREPAPQVRCPPLPHQLGAVVVAVAADGLSERGVVLCMMRQTGPWAAVFAGRFVAGVRVAAAAMVAPAVDGPERRSGEGREHQRVLGDRLGHRLAASDPGPDQLEHVRCVQARAGRALAGASVAAAHVGDSEWLLLAAVGRQDLPGGGVDHL